MRDVLLACGVALIGLLAITLLPIVLILGGWLLSFAVIVTIIWFFIQVFKDDPNKPHDPDDPGP